jgi:hypothetical protein
VTDDAGRWRSLLAGTYRKARFEAKTLLGRYPDPYLSLARRRARGEPLRSDTGFVIEGFPRSGNTFATAAFGVALDSMTSPRPVVAHHLHSPAQVIAAARRRIPALVLIRQPEDAVLSLVIQQPHLSVRQALRSYARFYVPLLPHRDRFVLATFDHVVRDFGEVTRWVNDRFGVDFPVFDNTDRSIRLAMDRIETENRSRWDRDGEVELKGAFPSAERTRLKERRRSEYRRPTVARLRARAERIYALLTDCPDVQPAGPRQERAEPRRERPA